jgi:hypothetical protein
MSRERMVVFLIAFFLLVTLSCSPILGSEINYKMGYRAILDTLTNFDLASLPVVGWAITAFISCLAGYVIIREVRGGF